MYALTRNLVKPGLFARTFSTRPHLSNVTPSAPQLDDGERNIYDKLKEKFNPSELLVQDVSGGCGSFYAITIASDAFKGMPIVKQHRMVNDVLKKEFESIHGLQEAKNNTRVMS